MKSFSINTFTLLFLFMFEFLRINFKFNFYVNTISVEALPQNDIKVSSDQNLSNLNANFNHEKIYDVVQRNKNLDSKDFPENKGEHFNFLKSNQKLATDNSIHPIHNIINSIDTMIVLKQNQTNGEIKEKINFELTKGKLSLLTRKISLQSSAQKYSDFRLSSYDVKLTSAKIVHNCYDSTSTSILSMLSTTDSYICVVANFEEIEVKESNKTVEIEYEYISENLLRKRTKAFTDGEEENVIIWVNDNLHAEKDIENVSLSILIEDKIDVQNVVAYPEKNFHHVNGYKNLTLFNWLTKDLKANNSKNFVLNVPIFNRRSKDMTRLSFDFSRRSLVQLFICIIGSSSLVVALFYAFVMRKDEKREKENREDKGDYDIKVDVKISKNGLNARI